MVTYLLVSVLGSGAVQSPVSGSPTDPRGVNLAPLASPTPQPNSVGPSSGAEPADDSSLGPADPSAGPGRSQPYDLPSGMPVPSRTREAGPPPPPALPPGCAGNWQYATDDGPVLGSGGGLLRFHVAVEYGLPINLGQFTGLVDQTLGDPRSWVGSGTVRLQHVSAYSGEDFTIYLACPWTSYNMCRTGGLDTRVNGYPYTSCRVGNMVVINADRYIQGANAVMAAGGTLPEYQHYLINHEVGHRLGYGHVHCPSAGQLAPIMQQQTLRMEGCIPNGWPYPYNPPAPPPPPTSEEVVLPPRTRDAVDLPMG